MISVCIRVNPPPKVVRIYIFIITDKKIKKMSVQIQNHLREGNNCLKFNFYLSSEYLFILFRCGPYW